MDGTIALRARQLERLRADGPRARAPDRGASPDRARALARAVRGRVVSGASGSIVEVEASGPFRLAREPLARLPDPLAADRPIVCLDTETTGLGTAAGTVAFLVGLGVWESGRLTVRQLLLPDHADEGAFLDVLAAAIPPDAWLVTYNGRAFDWPLLVTRYRLHARDAPLHLGHLDLLPLARQLWKHRLGDARLSSVETAICGVRRGSDLPGALIPARYLEFLRTGDGTGLVDVLLHNRQDVASLARLLHRLASALDPERFGAGLEAGDLGGLGRAYLRRRRDAEALRCLDLALERFDQPPPPWLSARPTLQPDPLRLPLPDRVRADRARLLARLGRRDEAVAEWTRLAEDDGRLASLAWVQVAKHREHVLRDHAAALEATRRAARLLARSHALGTPAAAGLERDLPRREARLWRHVLRAG